MGIDEVGRGPIAGPVAVCAFLCIKTNYELLITNGIQITGVQIRDSKKLTAKQREKWFEYLKSEKEKGQCDFAVSMVSAEWIDKVGIVRAIKKALNQSLAKLLVDPADAKVYLDGGLKAPIEYVNQETVIKGDELHPVISCASIVAKVTRDKLMTEYAQEYPAYGFEKHAGYGTKAHFDAIKKNGLTALHRKSFLGSYL
ncbi:MAG: ribonuclease HII [Patescibacteria group bacterium]